MDYNKMSLDELKEYAKSLGMTVGNIGKEKLISKIKEKESESKKIKALLQDDDLENNLAYNELDKKQEEKPTEPTEPKPIQTYEIIGMASVKHKNNYTYKIIIDTITF